MYVQPASRGRGVASVWAADPAARALGRALFEPMAETVDLPDEALMDAATAAQTVNVTINARDAESFRQSRTQIAADIARAVSLGRRGM